MTTFAAPVGFPRGFAHYLWQSGRASGSHGMSDARDQPR